MNVPLNRVEAYQWAGYFYRTDPVVAAVSEFYAHLASGGLRMSPDLPVPGCKDASAMQEKCYFAARDALVLGDCFVAYEEGIRFLDPAFCRQLPGGKVAMTPSDGMRKAAANKNASIPEEVLERVRAGRPIEITGARRIGFGEAGQAGISHSLLSPLFKTLAYRVQLQDLLAKERDAEKTKAMRREIISLENDIYEGLRLGGPATAKSKLLDLRGELKRWLEEDVLGTVADQLDAHAPSVSFREMPKDEEIERELESLRTGKK